MLTAIIGESCTGKSTLASALSAKTGARVYSGNDYLRLAKTEAEAKKAFADLLKEGDVIYVITETDQLALLPDKCLRVLVTADIELIKSRFAARFAAQKKPGADCAVKLPPPVAAMLEKKHGMFDGVLCDIHIVSGDETAERSCERIIDLISTYAL